ncbi:hypothetical protein D3C75_561900 [compost metagenome]
MFCAFASARFSGERLSTQLNTKNITVITIMMCAKDRMREHFFSASSPYSLRFATANAEMIGEWLKENTITGIASHSVIHKPLPVAGDAAALNDRVSNAALLHSGIRYNARAIKAATNGNTRMLIALTIICSPKRTMVIRPTIRIRDKSARGGETIPN